MSAGFLGIELDFDGKGLDEVGIVKSLNEPSNHLKVGDIIVRIDERYFRPSEVETLLGDASLAKEKLNWSPEISLEELCKEMMECDIRSAKKDKLLLDNGFELTQESKE
jgi:GDPmannose 4,6-dehydratase